MRITVILLLCCLMAKAQTHTNYEFGYIGYSAVERQQYDATRKKWDDSTRNSNVYRSVSVKYKSGRKGALKLTDSTIASKSSRGTFDMWESYDSKGRLAWRKTFGRDNAGHLVYCQMKYFQKKRGKSRTDTYTFSPQGLLLDATTYNSDSSKIISREVLAYDEAGNNVGRMHYTKSKLRQRMAFEYFNDGAKKATKYYTPKGKLSYVTNYECKSVGVTQPPKQKDTTTVCVRSQRDELGRRMEISEYAYGGKMSKYINYFDSLDQMVESISYNHKNEIATRWKEVNVDKNHSQYVVYKKGGQKISHINDYVSNPDGYTSTFLSKGVKPRSITKGYNFKRE